MEIKATQRLYKSEVRAKLLKPSADVLNAHAKDLATALNNIGAWYENNSLARIRDKFQPSCEVLVSLFGYTPYIGDVYRVIQYAPKLMVEGLYEGARVTLKTGLRPLQSWAASLSGALYYHSGNQFAVSNVLMRLISSGQQVANTDWLFVILDYLKSISVVCHPSIKAAAIYLTETLRDFAKEDEVVMLLSKNAKVEVMALLNWTDKRQVVRKMAIPR